MKIDMTEHLGDKIIKDYQDVVESTIYDLAVAKEAAEENLRAVQSAMEEAEAELSRIQQYARLRGGLPNYEH